MPNRVTLDKIAEIAKVSKATVSYVLSGKERDYRISDETAKLIRQIADQLEYIPNRAASMLRKGRHHLIAIIAPHVADFYAVLVYSIEEEAEKRDYQILLGSTFDNIERERKYLTNIISRRADGVIILPVDIHQPHLNVLEKRRIPTIYFRRRADSTAKQLFMTFDDTEVGRIAAEHLFAKGSSSVMFVSTTDYLKYDYLRIIHEARASGCAAAVSARGENVIFPQGYILDLARHCRESSGKELVSFVKEKKISGLVCLSDDIAAHVLQFLAQGGLKVPEDVRVIGCDNTRMAEFTTPTLSSIDLPKRALGEAMVRSLFHMIENERQDVGELLLPPRLVERDSTG